MPYIQTVTGPISPDAVGFCHCHEHLMLSKGVSYTINENLCIDDCQKTLQELQDFRIAGGATIVDAQPGGCNRMGQALVELSEESGVNIIAATGFHKMMFYPKEHWIFSYEEEQLTNIFIHEAEQGMYIDCDSEAPKHWIQAKAGIIKCALDSYAFDTCNPDTQYQKLFTATCNAAKRSGLPMMVHIEQNSDPLELVRFLISQNIDLNRVIFCHMDRACPDLALHKELCRQGIYMEYDTIGRFKYHDDQKEAAIFADLIYAGYEDRLLFSLDTTRERLKSYNADGVGLTYIIKSFIPTLKSVGVTDLQIKKISDENSARILSINSL